MSVLGYGNSGADLGFTFNWAADHSPKVAVVSQGEALVEQIAFEFASKASSLSPFVHLLYEGLSLPHFWAVVKTSDVLKHNSYSWWRLDESVKHLLASWIISRNQPKEALADSPVLWEIYPTIVIGSAVEARLVLHDGQWHRFNSHAKPKQYFLYEWNMVVDVGTCILLSGNEQIKVTFDVTDLYGGKRVRLLN